MAIEAGWLHEGESLLVPRLGYPLAADQPEIVHDLNRAARDSVVAAMLDGSTRPVPSPSYFGPEPEVTIGEVDRYGIPFRSVLGKTTGLLRADPYYSDDFLLRLWTHHYRELYGGRRLSHATFLADQIRRGQPILERIAGRLGPGSRVLDLGCGMGGMLVPFKFHGCAVVGCDYGEEYADRGRSLGLDIRQGGPETVASEDPFDFILLSHVVQHVTDPVAFLTQAAALLRPNGMCYIELPGLLNLKQWYSGDLLQYLQNANRWHFTAGTLQATLRRAGLQSVECDERITCLAVPAPTDSCAMPADGPMVLSVIEQLEQGRSGQSS
jgi:SAM-dependent methyltransferase